MKPDVHYYLRRGLGTLMVGCIGVGCASNPRDDPPTIESPPAFEESISDSSQGGTFTLGPQSPWWTHYDDPMLNVLMESLNASSLDIGDAQLQFASKRSNYESSFTKYMPTFNVHGKVSVEDSKAGYVGPDVSLDLTPPLRFFGELLHLYKTTAPELKQDSANFARVRLDAQVALADTYFEMRACDSKLVLLNELLAGCQESLERARYRDSLGIRDEGVDPVGTIAQELRSLQRDVTDARDTRNRLEREVAKHLGKFHSEFRLPPMPLDAVSAAIAAPVPSAVPDGSPELVSAAVNMQLASANVKTARTAFFPTVNPSATVTLLGQALLTGTTPAATWNVGADIGQMLFDGGKREAALVVAKAAYERSVLEYRKTDLSVHDKIEDQIADFRRLHSDGKNRVDEIERLSHSRDVIQARHNAGIVGQTDVINAKRDIVRARIGLVDNVKSQLQASIKLVQSLGGGWTLSSAPESQALEGERRAHPGT